MPYERTFTMHVPGRGPIALTVKWPTEQEFTVSLAPGRSEDILIPHPIIGKSRPPAEEDGA